MTVLAQVRWALAVCALASGGAFAVADGAGGTTVGAYDTFGAQQDPAAPSPAPAVVLPASDARAAVLALPADAAPAPLAALPWPAWDDTAWDARAPWQRWSELVLEEAEAPRPDAARRAALALCSALQGRHVDAWTHFAAAAEADPAVAAALLPRLMPGAPATFEPGLGGRAGAMPDGVLLQPVLPPLDEESSYGRPRVRAMTAQGLRIGAATCDMKVAVEADGIEISFTHRGGGPARVLVALPIPHDREVRSLYVDWLRRDELVDVVELELAPSVDGAESEAAIWARFVPRRLAWPAPGELKAPRQLARAGLVLVRDADDPLAARIDRLAEALALVLGLPAQSAARAEAPPGATAPLAVGFAASDSTGLRAARLAFLISAAERFRLRR